MSLRDAQRVTIRGGTSRPTLVLVHGYGCDQTIWRRVVPLLADEFQVVTYDQAGAGLADPATYDPQRHASLQGYADDLLAICRELDLEEVVVVGHSIAAMIGVLAHLQAPDLVAGLAMLSPSPRFVDGTSYVGGFSREQVDRLLEALSRDYPRWVQEMAPVMVGSDRPELVVELASAFLRTDRAVAEEFARVTFLSDNRDHLPAVQCPTLVVQASDDPFVPEAVGEYVRDQIPGSEYSKVEATGHFLSLTAPEETARAILEFARPIRSFLERTRG